MLQSWFQNDPISLFVASGALLFLASWGLYLTYIFRKSDREARDKTIVEKAAEEAEKPPRKQIPSWPV